MIPYGKDGKCQRCGEPRTKHEDTGRRASEAVGNHLEHNREEAIDSWIALRLSDGGTDGGLYPTKSLAVAHQIHEHQCAYMVILPGGISAKDAEAYICIMRQAYNNGVPLAHPDRDVITIGGRPVRL
jgi:hypothetical protein